MFNFIQKRYKSTELSSGVPKHFPPAIREWKNSVYSFNKNTIKDTALKDEVLYDTMWSHFASKRFDKQSRKSHRMRGLIRRSSSKRIFISKPSIKQYSDKNIITVFLFDRENELLKKRVYYLKRLVKHNDLINDVVWFNDFRVERSKQFLFKLESDKLVSSISTNNSINLFDIVKLNKEVGILKSLLMKKIKENNTKEIKEIKKKIKLLEKKISVAILPFTPEKFESSKNSILKKKKVVGIFSDKRNIKKRKKLSLTRSQKLYNRYLSNRTIKRTKINYNILPKYIIPAILRKRSVLKTLFMYSFLKWIVKYLFNINVELDNICNYCRKKGVYTIISSDKNLDKCSICSKNIHGKKSVKITRVIIKRNENILAKYYTRNKKWDIINQILYKLLISYWIVIISKFNKISLYKILKLFNIFKDTKYKEFIQKFLYKELRMINTLTALQFNRFKFADYTTKIKNFISTIYNKKTELNLVSLKYLHLDSDMFLDSLAVKLRKKKSRLLRILRKSLKLVKRVKVFSSLLEKKNALTLESGLYKKADYKKIHSVSRNNDILSKNVSKFNTRINILNNLKYKWIAGIRLEAKGRLTKRYTASRALFKYLNRGNLKNLDYLCIPSYVTEPMSVYRIRNQFKPNLQFTYKYANKRIGTFGLKGWINSV